jgi:hypothetical protein
MGVDRGNLVEEFANRRHEAGIRRVSPAPEITVVAFP